MRWTAFLALFALMLPASGRAGVWQRNRSDGTVEFSNVPKRGRGWRGQGGEEAKAAAPGGSKPPVLARASQSQSAFWFRERSDGVIEFTNMDPVGRKWKVLFKTGPGKAKSLRGKTDRVPAQDHSSARFTRFDEHIDDQQPMFGIPPAFVRAVIKTESDFDPRVVSSVGAMGLMQMMPGTARSMGVTDAFDPRQNIMGGSRYLQVLARMFCHTRPPADDPSGALFHCSREETIKVISGYHAGPGAVRKYGGMPPYQTTRAYVANVLGRFDLYQRLEREQETMAAMRDLKSETHQPEALR